MTTGFVSHHPRRGNIFAALRQMRVVTHPDCSERQTVCLEAARPTLPNLARGVANRANSASWGNSTQTTFSFVFPDCRHFCRRFPQLALRFRHSAKMAEFFQRARCIAKLETEEAPAVCSSLFFSIAFLGTVSIREPILRGARFLAA